MLLLILIICFVFNSNAQTIGGNSIYNFLKLPATPQLTGLGGINISNISNDIGLSFNNPALLRPSMHAQLTTVFNSMYAGIKNYHAMMGYTSEKLQTNFSLGTEYFDYGTIAQTDASGNVLGTFRPGDYVVQVSGSRKYLERWYYGATIKFIHSNYGLYRSDGLAMDVGVAYYDSTSQLQVSVLMKNMGVQLKRYEGTTGDDLPFDIQAGITKRLKNAPLQFSVTAQRLHQFNIRYNDTSFNNDNGFNQTSEAAITFDKIFRHIVIATQVYVGDKLEITAAYNHLRRAELNIYNATNGLNGFSLGVGVLFKKIQIRYARAYYQNNTAYNQFGLNVSLNEFSAL
jgi:hypothetical protein